MTKSSKRTEWLGERLNGIGASDASAVLGLNPYMSNTDLWEIKTRRRIQEDIGDKLYVAYGVNAENHLRALFALDYPQYRVGYKEYDLIRHPEHSFIFATLDGRLTEKSTKRKGILEIKTTEILKSMQKEQWKDKIPDNYYIQVLHQLLATGFDFAVLKAQLKYQYDDEIFLQTKHYHIERADVAGDLDYLQNAEIEFWKNHVETDTKPNLILPKI